MKIEADLEVQCSECDEMFFDYNVEVSSWEALQEITIDDECSNCGSNHGLVIVDIIVTNERELRTYGLI